jgi:ectoine hydroxylase
MSSTTTPTTPTTASMNAQADKAPPQDPYWSRTASQWSAAPREDPVVWGTNQGPLSSDELAAFERDGFRFEPQLVESSEAAELADEAWRMAKSARTGQAGVVFEPPNANSAGPVVRSLFRVHQTSSRLRQICQQERIVGIARQILGSDVYLHQSRINFKPALDGKEFFWHSDFETWHIEDGMPRMRAVSLSLNLTENHEFNGPLMVIPGSHHHYVRCVGHTPENHFQQSLQKQQYGVPDREALEMLVEQGGITAPKGSPGSGLFFECNLMHGSNGNMSPQPRVNLFLVFNSLENPLREPFGSMPPRPEFLGERHPMPIMELANGR